MDLLSVFIWPVLIEYWYIILIIIAIFFAKTFFFIKTPCLDQFPITPYTLSFDIGRLTPGVDNSRYDVYLSDTFCKSAKQFILRTIEEKAVTGQIKENIK